MKLCTITIKDEVWCVITGLLPSEHQKLSDEFAPFVDGYFFQPKYKLGTWDGRIRFYKATGKTYVRLLDKIVPIIVDMGYELKLIDNRPAVNSPSIDAITPDLFGDIEVAGRKVQLRDYQVECVKAAVEAGSGILLSGTGSGKTIITAAISKCYSDVGHRVITIVPSDDLVNQTYEWYKNVGLDVGTYSGSNKDLDHQNIVATWQALQHNPGILSGSSSSSGFGCILWDECHGIRGAVAQALLNDHAPHVAFRFGVTGTLPKSACELMSINCSVGFVLKEIPAAWLIENGYLAKVEIQPVQVNETYIHEEFTDYDAEKQFLSKSPQRLKKIADLIVSEAALNGNTLVLVNSIPFGKKLAALIKDSVFLFGESASDLRKEHYDLFETRDDLIVIASSGIASTGISIDRIFCLVLVDPTKSFIKAIQSIGRGLRMGRGKDSVKVIDVHSKLKWAKKHHRERIKFYKEAKYPILDKLTLTVKAE